MPLVVACLHLTKTNCNTSKVLVVQNNATMPEVLACLQLTNNARLQNLKGAGSRKESTNDSCGGLHVLTKTNNTILQILKV